MYLLSKYVIKTIKNVPDCNTIFAVFNFVYLLTRKPCLSVFAAYSLLIYETNLPHNAILNNIWYLSKNKVHYILFGRVFHAACQEGKFLAKVS